MAANIRPFFSRPVEFVYTGNAFSISGGSSYSDFPVGTWACPESLFHSVFAHLWNDGVEITIGLSDDLKAELTPSGNITIDWDNTTLRDILGFTGSSTALSDGVKTTATYALKYCWIPGFQRADQDGFSINLKLCADGVESSDGTWSGVLTGEANVYRTTITLGMEYETNLLHDADGSDVYKKARCLETFLIGSMTAMPTSDESVSPKGFWFYPDINDAIDICVLNTTEPWAEADDDGVQFGYTDSPNTRVFCATSPAEMQALRGNPALPASRIRYGVSFGFHTCPVPTEGWQYVDWGGA